MGDIINRIVFHTIFFCAMMAYLVHYAYVNTHQTGENFFKDNLYIFISTTIFTIYSIIQVIHCRGYWNTRVPYTTDVKDKVVIITGANSGAGLGTALQLAERNAHTIIMACRDERKALSAIAQIQQQLPKSNTTNFEFIKCDLSDLESIRNFANKVKAKYPVINYLINNAGMMSSTLEYTPQHIESTFGVCYLGPHYLTSLLLDNIKASKEGRIINVSSIIHHVLGGKIDIDDLCDETQKYYGLGFRQYAQAKLGLILQTKLLAKKLKEEGVHHVKTACLHPGVVNSEFVTNIWNKCCIIKCIYITSVGIPYLWVSQVCFKTYKQGASTTMSCLLQDFDKLQSGMFHTDNVQYEATIKDDWEKDAQILWDRSEEIIKRVMK